jgi:regulator of sigma E protease
MNLLIAIFAVGLLIALHEAGHFALARSTGMKVLKYSIGFFVPLLSWRSAKSGTVYQVGALPLGGFVQVKGMNPFEEGAFEDPESYQNKTTWRRILVIVAGPLANLLIAWLLFFCLYMVGQPEHINEPLIGRVVEDNPAAMAGIQAGDRILAINGEQVTTWTDLAKQINAHPGDEVTLLIARGPANFSLTVTPKDRDGIGLIGIGQATKNITLEPGAAFVAAGAKCAALVSGTVNAIGSLLGGGGQNMQAVGPVGIIRMAAATLESGVREFLALVAYLSVMFFLFNLLPVPALDGGRLLFLLYEAVSRRRVNPKFDVVINTIGLIVLLGLFLVITVKELFIG